MSSPQSYPRVNGGLEDGCLDVSTLVPHGDRIAPDKLKLIIKLAIEYASTKSGREILSLPLEVTVNDLKSIYSTAGKKLFRYFKKYFSDPAATAYQLFHKNYRDVGREQFRNQTLQKERMNSGWRYQYLVIECAHQSKRFRRIPDIGAAEADFNAVIDYKDGTQRPLSLYVSVKNRSNTMGGQDWPKAIFALEKVASEDRNRIGHYCCLFGIIMDRGQRVIRKSSKTKQPYSVNTEIWLSDFFWPFFTNYSYEEIMTTVLDVLLDTSQQEPLSTEVEVPEGVLESFGNECRKAGLIDENGIFNDPHKLVRLFTSNS